MNRYTLLLFCQIAFLFSCASLSKTSNHKDIVPLTKENFSEFRGYFKNESLKNKDSLSGNLYWSIFDFGYDRGQSSYFEFIAIDPNKLLVTFWEGKRLVKARVFTGKIEDGYFVFRRKFLIIPAILFNVYRNRKFRIGRLKNGNIITDYKQIFFGTAYIIIPAFERGKQYNIEFEKVTWKDSLRRGINILPLK